MSKILAFFGLGELSLSISSVIYLVITLAIASLIGFGVYEVHEVRVLEQAAGLAKQQISDLQASNKNLTAQLQGAQASAKVNDTVTVSDVTDKQTAVDNETVITTNAQSAITQVVKKYQPQGPAQVIPVAQQNIEVQEISAIQVDSMWKTYCAAVPASSAGCVAVPDKDPPASDTSTDPVPGPTAEAGPVA